MQALVRRAGHRVRGGYDAKAALGWAEIIRRDDPEFTYRAEFSMEDAKRAAVLGKDNWKNYPRAMMKARAMAEVCREACADVLSGVAYLPDELGPVVVDAEEDGPPETPVAPIQPEPERRPGGFFKPQSPGSNLIPREAKNEEEYASERERYAAAGRHAREVTKWEDNLALAVSRRDRAALRILAETARQSDWPIRSELVARAREQWVKIGQDISAERPDNSVDADPDPDDSAPEE